MTQDELAQDARDAERDTQEQIAEEQSECQALYDAAFPKDAHGFPIPPVPGAVRAYCDAQVNAVARFRESNGMASA